MTVSLCLAVLLQTAPPESGGVVATFVLDGERQSVTRADLALELARRFRLTADGEAALDHLIESTLVEAAAKRANVLPSPAAVRQRVETYRAAVEARGLDFEETLRERRMSLAEFARQLRGPMALDRLIMAELGLRSESQVTDKHRELWFKQARNRADVKTEPTELPPGVVAIVDDRSLTLLDLGEVLLYMSADDRREKYIRQVVARRLLDAEAERRGITITEADGKAEVERLRREVRDDPRYGGLDYTQILKSQGTTPELLARSPVLLAQIKQRRIVAQRYGLEELRRRLDQDRADIERRHGQRRQIKMIMIRANDGSVASEFVKRDFPAAERTILAAKQRIEADGMPFGDAARIYSDDPYTKPKGGDLGTLTRASTAIPDEVLEVAFALAPNEISEPIRTESAVYLVTVPRIEPKPTDEQIMLRLREELGSEYLRDLVDRSQIEIVS